ncbi:hypothetical protein LMG24076_02283 [Trinickia soli]|nr:hypothetical protein LMG24076_02283 [Trinickia soli]
MNVMIYALHHGGTSPTYRGRGILEAKIMSKFDLGLRNICDDFLG